ncbi:hypothetical protein LTR91_004867 [Friedmanniomyces endolithicus]|uniref:Endosomal spry domain-containing protein n=2 Tax=Friedmanniomyces endolithicus TaxID=329885 RepID=A0AAN6J919_9PEZI|nr:hypothetical protein LTR35_008379 [Friedmanniomyces endolithicus]KAK0294870.1 hypothetical protein LTS00_006705 [Friedmanniomyces endolithicus]KAK0320946.1 hypothetical protein LTR82_007863 [Friedmanniomyces endolithicus]KAK0824246.1 hypothetical protein LTR73_007928 [Friedmanniomyces endolithicus]KAK0926383.1 hypothetical protein LTR57_004240 [Friedmanniomyces endolithicus]
MAPTPPLLAALYTRLEQPNTADSVVPGLSVSSLELDKRSTDSNAQSQLPARDASSLGTTHSSLSPRNVVSTNVPGAGTQSPSSLNNTFFIVLFAIIGVAMVITALWFFFWAKNGGFHYQETDWDDYKSTVLRRKGPDGKTLSNATKSTKLGYDASTIAGTQHYRWQKQAARSVVGRDAKGRKGITAKRGWAKTHSVLYSDDYMTESFPTRTESDMTELRTEPDTNHGHSKRYRDRDVQQYKKEKPARVGGLNRLADGSHFGTTTAGSETMSEASSQPMLPKQRNREQEQERAERKARDEAARMERRWRKEAEEAAALIARENAAARPPPPPVHTSPRKKAATPSGAKPAAQKVRQSSRSASPRKRDFSYQTGAPSEVLSTAYTGETGTSGTRTASYYDEYRPRAVENPRYSSEQGVRAGAGRSRQSSPKKGAGRKAREGGYRRGADSDLD